MSQFGQTTPLPPGWEARYDPGQARYYFMNHATHETTWSDPRLSSFQPQPASWQQHQQPQAQPTWRPTNQSEQIQLRDMTPRTRTPSAPTNNIGETSTSTNLVDEDEEWKNALLESALRGNTKKEPSILEKVNMKENLTNEFKSLSELEVANALESCKYDEDMARAILTSLKEANEEKKRKEIEKAEKEREKKKLKVRREAEERRRILELEHLQNEREERAEQERLRARSAQSTASYSRNARSATPPAKVVETTGDKRKQEKQEKNRAAPKAKEEKTATTRNTTYVSAIRSSASGPQVSLRKGPDPSNQLPGFIGAAGPNKSLAAGPCRSNCKGPHATQGKLSLSKGANHLLHQGPNQHLLNPTRSITAL